MNTHRRLIVLILAVLLLFTLACTVVGVQTSTQVYEDERSETTNRENAYRKKREAEQNGDSP